MTDLKTRAVLNKKFGKFQKRIEGIYGFMGDGNGNVNGSRQPYVYVRQPDNTVIEVYNKRIQPKDGVPVLCGYDPLEPFLFQVLSIWTTSLYNPEVVAPANMMPKHGYRHQWGIGDDVVFVDKRQYLPARVGASVSGGIKVDIYQDIIYINGGWTVLAAQTLDLTTPVDYRATTAGKSRIVLLSYSIAGTITITPTLELTYNSELITDVPAIPSGEIALAAIRLYTGQTVIRDGYVNRDVMDCRTWLSSSGGTGASAFTGLTDTFASYSGLGGQYVKVKSDASGLETGTPSGTDDNKVMVSVGDVTPDYMENKAIAGNGIVITKNDIGGNERLEFSVDNGDFITRLVNGTPSAELFTIAGGVNEFDLLYSGGAYHLFYTNVFGTDTKYRTSSTIAGLSAATPATVITGGMYPSVILEGSTWHFWVWVNAGGANVTRHFTATSPTGTKTLIDSMTPGLADVSVRKWANNGKYYAGYKDISTLRIGIMEADVPDGPWTDKGYIFAGLTGYHSDQESDPCIFFVGSRAFVSFSAYDGSEQVVAIVEVDTTNFDAVDTGTVLVTPTKAWQQRNSSNKVFNPVWLPHDNFLYYSHNPSASGVTTGWGYLEPAAGGSGDVATDTIWDAKGDLAVGTGADTAAILTAGANGKVLTAASGEATGLKWDTPPGRGDVIGPATSANNHSAVWDGTDSKTLKDGGAFPAGLLNDYICILDQKAQGTAGGTFTNGAWRTRDLNTEQSDDGGHASVSSNQITLAAGTYICHISCPAFYVASHQARLWDITNSTLLLTGTSEDTQSSGGGYTTRSFIAGKITLAGSTVLEIQHQCATTEGTWGFGASLNAGVEIYTMAEFWKVA